MEQILDALKEFKLNIDFDIRRGDQFQAEYMRQSAQLAMAIGLLDGLGSNDNIPK